MYQPRGLGGHNWCGSAQHNHQICEFITSKNTPVIKFDFSLFYLPTERAFFWHGNFREILTSTKIAKMGPELPLYNSIICLHQTVAQRGKEFHTWTMATTVATSFLSTLPRQHQLVEKRAYRSHVWKYFAFEADQEGLIKDLNKPVCKRCHRIILAKGGNTSNLAKHLRDRHPDIFRDFQVNE